MFDSISFSRPARSGQGGVVPTERQRTNGPRGLGILLFKRVKSGVLLRIGFVGHQVDSLDHVFGEVQRSTLGADQHPQPFLANVGSAPP